MKSLPMRLLLQSIEADKKWKNGMFKITVRYEGFEPVIIERRNIKKAREAAKYELRAGAIKTTILNQYYGFVEEVKL
jgi:hypothetical protein